MNRFQQFLLAFGSTAVLFGALIAGYSAVSGRSSAAGATPAVGTPIPTGMLITPAAAKGAIFQDLNPGYPSAPNIRANQAAAVSVSPDGHLLAILTSGHNNHYGRDGKVIPELSQENLFLFDITNHQPRQVQVIRVPNTFEGLAWAPSSDRLFAAGGKDDAVSEFVRNGSAFTNGRTFKLGHHSGMGFTAPAKDPNYGSMQAEPIAGGLAVNQDGTRLLVANLQNDSVSLIDLKSGEVLAEQDLRPGIIDPKLHGQPGGSYPRCVAWTSPNKAYVGTERDREVIALTISQSKIQVIRRIPVHGQPIALIANRKGSRLYAALDNTDRLAVFDTVRDVLIEEFNVAAPASVYPNTKDLGGASPNALALTPNEATLLVSNGGENAVGVVRLSDRARGVAASRQNDGDGGDDGKSDSKSSAVIGLVPTGWYSTGVATSKDGATWYIINGKSPAGPSVKWCHQTDPVSHLCVSDIPANVDKLASNGFVLLNAHDEDNVQLQRAGFLTLPAPTPLELARLTKQVVRNDHFDNPEAAAKDEKLFSFLRAHIKHIIYIIKENRTYDQFFGDLEIGNGDPRLAIFPERISPNHHAIARNFVTLDNVLLSGEGSWTGWDWSTAARTNDFRERQEPILYRNAMGGDLWGANRYINVGHATSVQRHAERPISPADPDILPGARDVAALDGPGGEEGKGYIWDAVLRHGLTVRNYGFFELIYENPPMVRDPFAQKVTLFHTTVPSLMPISDPYYRGFEPAYPDFWRFQEWKREFDAFSASNTAPNLMLVQLGNDHLGNFEHAIDGVNTPETQLGDNDYGVGRIVETVAQSPFAQDTLIITIEDDTWDGPDHVDAFRSLVLVAGPYVRQHALVSQRYTTVSVVKTIEEILGVGPIGLNDALAAPMSEVFDPSASSWSYKAIVPDALRSTKLPLPAAARACIALPKHSSDYWAKAMADQDFSSRDRGNPVTFNRALWRGLRGDEPYPATPTGADLRTNRDLLLPTVDTAKRNCAL